MARLDYSRSANNVSIEEGQAQCPDGYEWDEINEVCRPTQAQTTKKEEQPATVGVGNQGGGKDFSLSPVTVPANIYEIIRRKAREYGVPEDIIAAVAYQESGFNVTARNDNTRHGGVGIDRGIMQINSYWYPHVTDAQADDAEFAIDLFAKEAARNFSNLGGANLTTSSDEWKEAWVNAASLWHNKQMESDAFITYKTAIASYVGAGTVIGRDANKGSSAERQIPGMSEDQSRAAHAVADGVYLKYLGRLPTDAEYQDIIRKGWNPAVLEDYVRSLRYSNSGNTVGAATDLREEAQKWAREVLGRDADEQEINWLIVNRVPATHVSAFYEQIRDKAPWSGDPDSYRAMRANIANIFGRKFGMTIADKDISVDLVNKAVTGKWTDDQIMAEIRKAQMPGLQPGVTIGQYTSTKGVADQIWSTYFPGQDLTAEDVEKMIGMTPDQILKYIRGLPSKDLPGVAAGDYYDARLTATDILARRLGFLGRLPKKDEIAAIISGKKDVEGIEEYYRNLPELVKIQPGLPYKMEREEYYARRLATEQGYAQLFGEKVTAGVAEKAAKPEPGEAPAEPEWLKSVFKQGLGENETRRQFSAYFRNLGRPPTTEEVGLFKGRIDHQFTDRVVEAAGRPTDVGPTQPSLGGPSQKNPFGRKRVA